MARLIHERAAAETGDFTVHPLAAFDVADDGRTGVAGENIARKDEHQHVAEDGLAVFIDGADAVGIAIEADTEVGAGFADFGGEGGEIFGSGGVRVVMGEVTVHVGEQGDDVTVEAGEDPFDDGAGGAITGIDDDLAFSGELELMDDLVDVGRDGVGGGEYSGGGEVVLGFGEAADGLNIIAVEGGGAAEDFATVVVRRVMAAGDDDRAVGLCIEGREVEHGRGHDADVGDCRAGGEEALEKGPVEARGGEAAIAAEEEPGTGLALEKRPNRAAEVSGGIRGEVPAGDPANVAFAKDRGIEHFTSRVANGWLRTGEASPRSGGCRYGG